MPDVKPEQSPVEAQFPGLQKHRGFVAEKLAQAMQRRVQRAVPVIAVDVRPERVSEALGAHILAAKRNQRLKQLQRPAFPLGWASLSKPVRSMRNLPSA